MGGVQSAEIVSPTRSPYAPFCLCVQVQTMDRRETRHRNNMRNKQRKKDHTRNAGVVRISVACLLYCVTTSKGEAIFEIFTEK